MGIQQFKFVINAVPTTADIWSVFKYGMLARMSDAPIYGHRASILKLA
jgi:energy-converting hydrogenase Eha subunit H